MVCLFGGEHKFGHLVIFRNTSAATPIILTQPRVHLPSQGFRSTTNVSLDFVDLAVTNPAKRPNIFKFFTSAIYVHNVMQVSRNFSETYPTRPPFPILRPLVSFPEPFPVFGSKIPLVFLPLRNHQRIRKDIVRQPLIYSKYPLLRNLRFRYLVPLVKIITVEHVQAYRIAYEGSPGE